MLFGEFKAFCEAGQYNRVYRVCQDHPAWLRWAEKKFSDFDYAGYLLDLEERRAALYPGDLGSGSLVSSSIMAQPLRTRRDYTSVARKTLPIGFSRARIGFLVQNPKN